MSENKPQNIWVLYGGSSAEREVSLRSGQGIAKALATKGFHVDSYDVRPGAQFLDLPWKKAPDIVFLGLHGTWGEDGTIQGFLESLDIAYVGSGVLSSALCFHKGLAKKQLQQFQVPCPHSIDVFSEVGLDFLSKHGNFQNIVSKNWFIKPARQGSTIGIERYNAKSGDNFLELCKKALKFDEYLVIEEWIQGRELTVPLLHGKAMPIVEIKALSDFYDYESKYTKGKTQYLCPAPLPEAVALRVSELAELAFQALDCADYGRVDFMLKDGTTPLVLEMNTLPGMTETSLVPKSAVAAGMDYAGFLEKLVLGSWQRQRKAKHGK